MLINIDTQGIAHCKCSDCGVLFDYGKIGADVGMFGGILKSIANNAICDSCQAKKAAAEKQREIAERKARLLDSLDDRMASAGFAPRFSKLEQPYVRHTAEWLWDNKDRSVILAGLTGTGKTSSAAFISRFIMRERFAKIRYTTRQGLIADYVRAKTNDDDSEQAFYRRLGKLDILIIDEMVGKKGSGRLSDSSQELFFNIIDGVYSMERETRIWLLGNFYAGAIDDLFDDPAPVKRRLADSFALGWVDGARVENIALA